MKKNQNSTNNSKDKNKKERFLMKSFHRFYTMIGCVNFDPSQYIKTENEKLQIRYANIRV
ncbi:MAG: hypothetical protein ACRC6O_11350 [Flavobacterium sp.]